MNERLNWKTWGDVFQDINYFRPLINRIFKQEHLGDVTHISTLTPGTNAVFKVNNYVLKLFVPDDVKPWSEDDFTIEKESITRALNLGIKTPKIITSGYSEGMHLYNYLVLEYIDAKEVGNMRHTFDTEEKRLLVTRLRTMVDLYNSFPQDTEITINIKERVLAGGRWSEANHRVKQELIDHLNRIDLTNSVYVHGDLTGENVLSDDRGELYIIDFADSTVAPYYYEYPPILFDLFDCDKEWINLFFMNKDKSEVVDDIFKGILLHDFGGDFATIILKRFQNKSLKELSSLEELRDLIRLIIN